MTPDGWTRSPDGTSIARFTSGTGPPVVLIHGAAADHTTFRVLGPMLAERFTVHAIDRRGRGASTDSPRYAIEREFEDVAAVADDVAAEAGRGVAVVGHSYGGRCALGAALLTGSIERVVSYEGAPSPPGTPYGDSDVARILASLAAAGQDDELLRTFLARVVGMSSTDLARYAADPVWPLRVAAASTIVRELRAESTAGAGSLDHLGAVRQPVLQVLGGDSLPAFASATEALQARLSDGQVAIIDGARHAAHHTHPDVLLTILTDFLQGV